MSVYWLRRLRNLAHVGQAVAKRRASFRAVTVALLAASMMMAVMGSVPAAASQTWTLQSTPNASGQDRLLGAACNSATDCTAVGYYVNGSGHEQTLIETTTGGSGWSIVSSPNASTYDNWLNGVSCTSATDCTAVGFYNDSSNDSRTLIEATTDGKTWSIISSADVVSTWNQLTSVSCTAASECTAVGAYWDAAAYIQKPLVETTTDGKTWAVVSSQSPAGNAYIQSVSCTSATNCTAVGDYDYDDFSTGYIYKSLIETTTDGKTWSIVPSPNNGTGGTWLSGVSCTSATDCTAVGDYIDGGNFTLVERTTDGSTWSTVASPNAGSDQLHGVSCTSATDCTAAGYSIGANGYSQTLVETTADGSTWSTVSSPNASTYGNYLNGVSCTSAADCTAVGYASDQTLAMSSATVATVPGAPTGLTATAGDSQVALSWNAPASDGGSPITGYAVNVYTGSDTSGAPTVIDTSSTSTGYTVTGLTNGTTYTFTVQAQNTAGTGPASNSVTATPDATLSEMLQQVQSITGLGTSLTDKLTDVQNDLAMSPPDITDACITLGAFINEVNAQTGKAIDSQLATTLVQEAQALERQIGC